MQGLLLTLSGLDATAESAVRLISFFDSLVEQRVDLECLVSRAAMVADRTVGVQGLQGSFALRGHPDGSVDHGRMPRDAASHPVGTRHVAWLAKRREDPLPLDELVLERFAIACIATFGRDGLQGPSLGDPGLLDLVIAQSTSMPERARALHLLGHKPPVPVTALAVAGPADRLAEVGIELAGSERWSASVGAVRAALVLGTAPPEICVPQGFTVGVGATVPGLSAPESWDQALRALRFAAAADGRPSGGRRAVVRVEELGPLAFLAARLRSADIKNVPDIESLDLLEAEDGGADLLRTLECFIEVGSLREAARQLHLHHNSVAARVARAERSLGYSITVPRGIARVGLAIALRRLRDHDLLA